MKRSDDGPDGSALSARRLSRRGHQVALLVFQGLCDASIARRLGLAGGTVGNYVRQIQRRLKLGGRAEIAAWVAARVDPCDPTGRLRRREDARTQGDGSPSRARRSTDDADVSVPGTGRPWPARRQS